MNNATINTPTLLACLEAVRVKFEIVTALRNEMKIDTQSRELKAKVRLAEATHNIALKAAYAAIGSELLPGIFGGAWKETKLPSWVWTVGRDRFVYPLFDHRKAYRKIGAKGPSTWENTILLSEPYDAMDRQGVPTKKAVEQAVSLRRGLNVGTWIRKDLSPHFPGWTTLVLVGSMLDEATALSGGFTTLA